jgi:hypothetical protein
LNAPLTGKKFGGDPSRREKFLLVFEKNIR